VALYLCSKFCIFDRLVLEGICFLVEGGLHVFQSYLCAVWHNLPPVARAMHLVFKSLAVTKAQCLYMMRSQFLEGLKCESQTENIGRAKSRGHSLACNT
jgi:hypothetical protein